ncbi:MAG TPA: hypothetical protein VLF95_09885 [Vicinamibacteria bacterium]|nr:hypothetical protein [Vicinamibacteria bacterium]
MTRMVAVPALALSLCVPATGWAQDSGKLALLIPQLYGPDGLRVDSKALLPDGSTHSAHFNSAFQAEFTQFNIALASQLAAIPLPTPASGFTYTFDSSLGVFQRSTQSFGPILTERADTIGKGKVTFGVTFQHFGFDSLEGVSLRSVPAVFTHDQSQLGGGRSDVVTTTNSIEAAVDQGVAFLSYGLGSRVDLSVAVPFVSVDLGATSRAEVQRVGTATSPATHFYDDGSGTFGIDHTYARSGHASGIGDVVVRLKANPVHNDSVALALGIDGRIPTGDEEDLLGLGAFGVKPFLVLSLSQGRVAPHLNVAYLWNGKSVLAGDVGSGRKADLPDQVQYAVGADIGVAKRLTLAFDFLGTYVIDSPRLVRETFTAANGEAFPQIGFVNESYSLASGAAGLKLNPVGRLLVDFNVLFRLDSAGLRDKVTPLVGIEYAF